MFSSVNIRVHQWLNSGFEIIQKGDILSAIHPSELSFITKHAPFDRMELANVLWMLERMQLGYYAEGEVIVSPEQGAVDRFLVIKQGMVQGEQNVAHASEADTWLELAEGECFPLGALLANRPCRECLSGGQRCLLLRIVCGRFSGADRHECAHSAISAHAASPICWSIPSRSFRRSTVIRVSNNNRWPVPCRRSSVVCRSRARRKRRCGKC